MGAGILPASIHNNKLYFLFGKENVYEDSAHGFSDFGGGTDNNESFTKTAIREACEEFTGFLGSQQDLHNILKKGSYNIDYKSDGFKTYRMHIIPMKYNEYLPLYYNNNQRFLQKKLDPKIIQNSKIFEKEEIKWMSLDEAYNNQHLFRPYFTNIIKIMYSNKVQIKQFIQQKLKKTNKHKIHKTNNKNCNRKTKKI